MEKKDLKSGYFIFGNKGNVWSDKCHIAKSGFNPSTLCGVPMLSTNIAELQSISHIGCKECIEIYKKENQD